MPPPRQVQRPFAVTVIALFQLAKGGLLLVASLLVVFAPDLLPHSQAFSQILFVAAHGKPVTGTLVPLFGLYICYIGVNLLRLKPSTRRNLAVSSALTIALSLQRLGVFGDTSVESLYERQSLYILIFLDVIVYFYLAFHPEIRRSFSKESKG